MSSAPEIPWLSGPVMIDASQIPREPNVDIRESTLFQNGYELPTTEEVRFAAMKKHSEMHPDWPLGSMNPIYPPEITFEDKNIFVKWGGKAQIMEAQCLFTIRRHFGAAVPVPEVYGWRTEGDVVYIFMELISGQTLESVWESLETHARDQVCSQIRTIFHNLRLGQQDDQTPAIGQYSGNIIGGPLSDRAIGDQYRSETGPFRSVQEFHDWFSFLCRRPMDDPYSIPIEPFRKNLQDDSEIKLTNGDLHRRNIMVTTGRSPRIVAVVDWEQSGWFPAYWEVRKAFYTTRRGSEWTTRWLPTILDPYDITTEPWEYYVSSLGN